MSNSIKCTKSDLNKAIEWSSSRYNERKKPDAVEEIIFRVEKGEDYTGLFQSGCYSEGSHGYGRNKSQIFKCKNTGGHYWLVIKDGVARLYNSYSDHPPSADSQEEYVTILKPAKNRYLTNAKQIKVLETTRFGIAPGIYDVQEETKGSFYFFYAPENRKRCLGKKECFPITGEQSQP
jgi:hypothetical protein